MEVPLGKMILILLITVTSASYDFIIKPEFGERARDLNITSFAGQTSRLPCTVKHLSGKRVSWIRQRDLQVLSTGRITFSTDLRISVLPGTRFKLRKPRNLLPQDYLPRPDPNRTNRTTRDPTNEDQMLTSPRLPSRGGWVDGEWNGGQKSPKQPDIRQPTRTHFPIPVILTGVSFKGNEERSFHAVERKNLKREARSVGHKHHRKRQKQYWYREDHHHWNPLNFQQRYTSKGNSHRSKKALTASFQKRDEEAFTKAKSLAYSGKDHKTERFSAYAKQSNPIAIYPQGPISSSSDGKGLQPAPNYIDGVWEPEDYTLQIKYTKPEDAGIYICQINTEPRITQAVILKVVKMRAEILGRRELFIKAGNPVRLSCKVNHGALTPGFILWYKGERLVEYENSGGRIQIVTEVGGVSHLLLKTAQPEDSANYTCSPAGGAPASLILNVIVDERQAAMQQGNFCPNPSAPSPVLWPAVLFIQLLWCPADHLSSIPRLFLPGLLVGLHVSLSFPRKLISLFLNFFVRTFVSFVSCITTLSSYSSSFSYSSFSSSSSNLCFSVSSSPFSSFLSSSSSSPSSSSSSSSSPSSPPLSHPPSLSPPPLSTYSTINIANLLHSYGSWILGLNIGFLPPLYLCSKEIEIICFIVIVCVFVSLEYETYVYEYTD